MAHAVKRGSVQLNSKLVLRDVLYVPSLDCNLISIYQLLDEICCMVTQKALRGTGPYYEELDWSA